MSRKKLFLHLAFSLWGMFAVTPGISQQMPPFSPSQNHFTISPPLLPSSLTVSASGEYKVVPDTLELSLGFVVKGSTPSDAQKEVSRLIISLAGKLKSSAVGLKSSEMQTAQSKLSPVYDNKTRSRTITAYTAVQTIKIQLTGESRKELIDRIMKLAEREKVNRIDYIRFTVSSAQRQQAEEKAIVIASENALTKAKTTLKALNLELKRIKRVGVSSRGQPAPYPVRQRAQQFEFPEDGGYAYKSSIANPGEIPVRTNVSLTVEF